MLITPRRTINLYKGELKDIIKTFFSKKVISGKEIEQFEKKFAEFIGSKEVITISSGRIALKVILECLELPPGSEIIIPAYTADEVPGIISNLGFKPIFVDIKSSDHNINVALIEQKITGKCKAIIATHIFGIPCDIEEILKIAQRHSLLVIEDCAHALGAVYKREKIGNFGIASFFSFSNTKPFNTFGGGAISTNNKIFAEKVRSKVKTLPLVSKKDLFKNICVTYLLYMLTHPFIFSFFVYPFILINSLFEKDFSPALYSATVKKFLKPTRKNTQLSNLQAIIGIKQLDNYKCYFYQTRKKVDILSSRLSAARYLTSNREDIIAAPYFFVIVSNNAISLSRYLLMRGIDSGKYLMRFCPKYFNNDEKDYPKANEALNKSIQIPLHTFINEKKVIRIAEVINGYSNSAH